MKKQSAILLAALLLCASATRAWDPKEQYGKFVRTFQVDKAWQVNTPSYTDTDEGGCGDIDAGIETKTFPGFIAWSAMIWDEHCGSPDDYQLDRISLSLYNRQTGEQMALAKVQLNTSDDDDTRFNYTVDQNGMRTYSITRRYYKNYYDGAQMGYFMTRYSEQARQFIEAAGNYLSIKISARWDNSHWRDYNEQGDINSGDLQFIPVPNPVISDVHYSANGDKTDLVGTISGMSGLQYQNIKVYTSDNQFVAEKYSADDGENTITLDKLQTSWVEQQLLRISCGGQNNYSYDGQNRMGSSSFRYAENEDTWMTSMPETFKSVSGQGPTATPIACQMPLDGSFQIVDLGTGTLRVEWQVNSTQSGVSYDQSDWILEFGTSKDFSDASINHISWARNLRQYNKAFDVELEQGSKTYYARLSRASMGVNMPLITTQRTVNTDYKKVTELEVTPDMNAQGELTGKINVNWHLSEGLWPNTARLMLRWGESGSYQARQSETGYRVEGVPTCTPLNFTLQVVDGNIIRNEQVFKNFVLPSTVPSRLSAFSVSKGYYNDRVEVHWAVEKNAANYTRFILHRKEYGDADNNAVTLKTLSFSQGEYDYAFTDETAIQGIYYEYTLDGYTDCDTTTSIVTSKTEVGFSQPYGIVSGQIVYSGNQGVQGVTVSAFGNDTRSNHSLHLQSGSLVSLPNGTMMMQERVGTIELFFRPDETQDTYTLIQWPGHMSLSVPDSLLTHHRFNHVAWSWQSGQYTLFVDGLPKLTDNILSLDGEPVDSIYITGVTGYMDELRFWSAAHDSAAIAGTCGRYLAGTETGLTGYYRCDDPIPGEIYDISRTGTRYNEHHGRTLLTDADAQYTPTEGQLSLKAETDQNGNYLINAIPYTADGSLYSVTPTFGIHEFSPASKPLFFTSTTSTHNNVDFTDVSSFSVKGAVFYENTTVPVKGVKFKIDGTTYCTKEGKMIESDQNGEFELSVPIGRHFIQAEMSNHTFANEGRYPAGEGQTIVVDHAMENLRFYDQTTVLLVGRVAGGKPESKKPHGFGKGKCNIGMAEITLSLPNAQQSLNTSESSRLWLTPDTLNCRSTASTGAFSSAASNRIIIRTDSLTGEFAVAVPPIDMSVSKVELLSDPDYSFGASCFRTLALSSRTGATTTDTLRVDGALRKCSYALAFDAIRINEPTLTIQQGYDQGLGERSIHVLAGERDSLLALYQADSIGKITYTLGHPIFRQEAYTWKMSVADIYTNHDGLKQQYDTIPWSRGRVTIQNELDGLGGGVLMLDSAGQGTYSWVAGTPQLVAPYQMGMQIAMTDSLGQNPSPWKENDSWKGILLGGKQDAGSDFVTMGPSKIVYILRCPPGKASTVTWKAGSTIHVVDNTWSHWNGHEELVTRTAFGTDLEVGTGIGAFLINKLTAKNNLTVGFQSDQTKTWNHINSSNITTQSDLTTDRSSGLFGSSGDVYYGYSTNLLFGTCQSLSLQYNAQKDSFEFHIGKAVSMGDTIATTFQYSQHDIINSVIPNLKLMRSKYPVIHVEASQYDSATYDNSTAHFMYITQLAETDPARYESGNFLPVRPKQVTHSTADSLTMYNCAIKGWEDAIRRNEEMKVIAIRQGSAKYDEEAMKTASLAFDCYCWMLNQLNNNAGRDSARVNYSDISRYWKVLGRHYTSVTWDDVTRYYITKKDFQAWKRDKGVENLADDEVTLYTIYKGGYLLENESVSGGAKISKSFTTQNTTGMTTTFDFTCLGILGDETGMWINGTGVVANGKTTQGGGDGWTSGSDTTRTNTVAYSLTAAKYENYTVDVLHAPDNFGPIFYVRGGETYCPYEKPETTKYYTPATTISAGTIQMEQPQITAGGMHNYSISDVPSGTAATLKVQLANLANIENKSASMEFELAVVPQYNPNGLDIRLNGRSIGFDDQNFWLHCPESIDETLTIQQTDRSVNEYNRVALVMRSACQPVALGDTLWLTVHFVPDCTPLQVSAESTTLSSITSDTLALTLSGYDRNYYGLQDLRIERRKLNDVQWLSDTIIGIRQISSSQLHIRLPFTSATWPDGQYEVRAVSRCQNDVESSSNILTITKDMQLPTLLGSPEPSNGYYTLDNELAINWSEAIQNTTLSKARNFQISGALNAAEVDHDVAVDLMNESYTEATFLVNNKSFGCELWLRTRSDGTIIAFNGEACQASIENGKLRIHLGGKLGGTTLTSTASLPQDTWMYLYINFNQEGETSFLNAYAYYDANSLMLFNNIAIPTVSNNGNIAVGGGMQGEMHGLRLWSTVRTPQQAQAEMHQTPDLYTTGLLSYWPMNEGYGTTAEDKLRSRNMTIPDNAWYLYGTNYALAVSDTALMDITTANMTANDEYVLEYWFRTRQADTLFSVISGKKAPLSFGQAGQTLYLWSPLTGNTYSEMVSDTLNNNQWHHFALSYVRNGYASLYIDGQARMTVPQAAIGGLRGSAIRLHAGDYDEIRFWRGRLDASLIAGRRYQRCTGSEAGLTWRFAFEKDQLDSGNQHQTVFTTGEALHADSLVRLTGSLAKATTCPPLQAARTEEDVLFDFTSTQTRTVFTLTSDANRIEGATLTCTARLVPDVAGNLSQPISWQVKVNRCQLDWYNKSLELSTTAGIVASQDVIIYNQSGIDDTWKITGLPDWLTLSATESTIPGMSYQTLTLYTSESLSPGYYYATLALTGKQGVKKTLDIILHVHAILPNWNMDDSSYDQSMSIIGQVVLPNGYVNSSDHLLGVFDGDHCIGLAAPRYISNYGAYFVMLTVYGNKPSANPLTFRFWDSTTGRVFSPLSVEVNGQPASIRFTDGQVIGGLMNPVIFRCDANLIQQDICVKEGWNWLSYYIEPASTRMSDVMKPVLKKLIQVKDATGYSLPSGDTLRGTVSSLSPERMYKARFSDAAEWSIEGQQYLASEHPITLHPRWNWIGFLSTTNMPVKQAFSNYRPAVDDVIKSRSSFSVWDGDDWVGTLSFMEPGAGYMYYSSQTTNTTFVYPSVGKSKAPRRMVAAADSTHFTPDVQGDYPTTMSVVAQVRDGETVRNDWEVGAFVGNSCRGAATPSGEDGLLFLSLEGDTYETLSFHLYNRQTGEERVAAETLTYAADSLVGTLEAPFIFQLDPAAAVQQTTGTDGSVYKTIRDNRVFIIRNGEWYDVLGRKKEE